MSTNEDFAHTWMNVKTGELRHNVSRIISAEQDQSIHIYKQRKEYFHNLNENFGAAYELTPEDEPRPADDLYTIK